MNALLTTVVLWLSANFELPALQDHPRIEFVNASRMVELRYKGVAGANAGQGADASRREPVALYIDVGQTIYLPDNWRSDTPAEVSILVHEMVHHLQNVGKLRFDCPQEREQLAYKAQQKWLELFGTDLQREFDLDPFTIFVSSKCIN
jgi:hypothetical protein